MIKETIQVANVKCDGCGATITKRLSDLIGVNSVTVIPEEDAVKIEYAESTSREVIIDKLHSLGYPEATEENGLLLQLKSYASCMVGRISK